MRTQRAAKPDMDPSSKTDEVRGYLSEMFFSVQGEGMFVGERQVFLRTAGCSATCSWCDTVYSKIQTPRFVIHDHEKTAIANPLTADTAATETIAFARAHSPVSVVSITGGEPLEQPDFVADVAMRLRAAGLRVYLETNGVHAQAMTTVLEYVDVVAMDIKLPSAVGVDLWAEHRAFLSVLRGHGNVFVKVIVDPRASVDEVATAAAIVAEASPDIPLVLQPESTALLSARTSRDDARRMMNTVDEGQREAAKILRVVRVIPQCHKILKVR